MEGSLELFLQSPQCHLTSGHGRVRCAPWKGEGLTTGELHRKSNGNTLRHHDYYFFFH